MIPPRPLVRERTLTGRVRARPGWFGRQILQVEVATLAYSACPPPPGRDLNGWKQRLRADGTTTHSWRDATWEDTISLVQAGALEPRRIEPSQPWPRSSGVDHHPV